MLNISFDFNEETKEVSRIKVSSIKEPPAEPPVISKYDVEVGESKLILSPNAVKQLNAKVGDRISINYWNVSKTETYPIISKSEIFTDGIDGNQLRKKNTISFRGDQRLTLLHFGQYFVFEEWKDRSGKVQNGVFKLIPVEQDDTDLEKLEHEIADFDSIQPSELEDDANNLLNGEDDDWPF